MEFRFFIGIDVSKNELDFAVRRGREFLSHSEIANSPKSIRAFLGELSKIPGLEMENTLFCVEHTGIYNGHLLKCLQAKGARVCLEPAVQIKQSLGRLRGKNDKVDAVRISEYAYEKREKLKIWTPRREVVDRLAQLSTLRSRLITARKMVSTPLGEAKSLCGKQVARELSKLSKNTLKGLDRDLEKVDTAIRSTIEQDAELSRIFARATSVDGIGRVTATQIIITTNEFKDIDDPKKYACYAGVAPFTEESGKVRGRPHVSHMANKQVKKLLHMSALVAIQHNEDLRAFYERKVNGENKNKMSVINAVRNKLVARIFACVKQDRNYENKYQKTLV